MNDQGSRTHIGDSAAMVAASRDHLDWLRRELDERFREIGGQGTGCLLRDSSFAKS